MTFSCGYQKKNALQLDFKNVELILAGAWYLLNFTSSFAAPFQGSFRVSGLKVPDLEVIFDISSAFDYQFSYITKTSISAEGSK